MANNRLKFDGLQELRAELRRLPKDLRDEAQTIVFEAAEDAAADVRVGYERHRVSGDLADKVKVQQVKGSGEFFAGAMAQNTSPLAMIFENGSQARHTDLGYNRGAMPPGNVFVPAMIKSRKEMYDKLRQLLRSKGLKVIG